MSINLPYRFPSEAQKIREEALAFRKLSPAERFTQILDHIASGETLMAASPKREIARRLRDREEAEWRQRMKELIEEHLRVGTAASTESDDRPG